MSAPTKEAFILANNIAANMPPAQRKLTAAAFQALIDERDGLRLNVPDTDGYRKLTDRADNAERSLAEDREQLRGARDALRDSRAKLAELVRRIRKSEPYDLNDFEETP